MKYHNFLRIKSWLAPKKLPRAQKLKERIVTPKGVPRLAVCDASATRESL